MKPWTKILPFFIVEWLAKKHLEKFYDEREARYFVRAFPNVRIYKMKKVKT